jgi:hypothetical protein
MSPYNCFADEQLAASWLAGDDAARMSGKEGDSE